MLQEGNGGFQKRCHVNESKISLRESVREGRSRLDGRRGSNLIIDRHNRLATRYGRESIRSPDVPFLNLMIGVNLVQFRDRSDVTHLTVPPTGHTVRYPSHLKSSNKFKVDRIAPIGFCRHPTTLF